MKELSMIEVSEVSGGFDLLNLGAALVALAFAAMTGGAGGAGGAGGVGMVLCGMLAAQGINDMEKMGHEDFGSNTNEQLGQK